MPAKSHRTIARTEKPIMQGQSQPQIDNAGAYPHNAGCEQNLNATRRRDGRRACLCPHQGSILQLFKKIKAHEPPLGLATIENRIWGRVKLV